MDGMPSDDGEKVTENVRNQYVSLFRELMRALKIYDPDHHFMNSKHLRRSHHMLVPPSGIHKTNLALLFIRGFTICI